MGIVLNSADNFVKYGKGATSLKKNMKKINLDKKIIWKYVNVPGLGVHICYCVLIELRLVKQIGGVRVTEEQKLSHEQGIRLILFGIFSRTQCLRTRCRQDMVIIAAIVKRSQHLVILIFSMLRGIMMRGQLGSSDCFFH